MIYDLLARIYDVVNHEVDYVSWADFIENCIRKYHTGKEKELILDLGCGTGRMTAELAGRGYDMTGVDVSAEMLEIARAQSERNAAAKDILWLCQDMRSFELYGTVGTVISCLDTVNHITERKDLAKVVSLVHNYLVPDGLFIFDVNGKAKFENVYAKNSFVYEVGDDFCTWENDYRQNTRLCRFLINLFEEGRDGRYERYTDVQYERMYTIRTLKKALTDGGFEFVGAFSDFDFSQANDECERIFVVAKCKKPIT